MNADFLRERMVAAALRNEAPNYKDLHVPEEFLRLVCSFYPEDYLHVIEQLPEDVDYSLVTDIWLTWMLNNVGRLDQARALLILYERKGSGDLPRPEEWKETRESAWMGQHAWARELSDRATRVWSGGGASWTEFEASLKAMTDKMRNMLIHAIGEEIERCLAAQSSTRSE